MNCSNCRYGVVSSEVKRQSGAPWSKLGTGFGCGTGDTLVISPAAWPTLSNVGGEGKQAHEARDYLSIWTPKSSTACSACNCPNMIVSWCKLQAKSIWDQIYLLSWSCWFSLSLWFCSSSWSSGPFFLLVFFIPTPSSWVEDRSTPYTFVCSMRHVHVYVQRHACIRVHPLSPSQGFLLIFIDFNTKCILFFADVCDSDSVWCWMPRIVAANAVANGNRKQAERQLGVQHAQVVVTFEMYLYLARNDKCGLPGGLICCGQAISSTVDVGRCRSILETGHSQRAACVGFCSRYMNRDRAPACHFRFAWIHRSNYIHGNRMHPAWFLVGYFFDPGLLFFDGFSELWSDFFDPA